MNDHLASSGVPSVPAALRLRLVHSHGVERDGMVVVPAAGGGLAEAIELGGERLNDAQWRAANLCRIAREGDGWQLINGSHTLVCALNGERVMVTQSVAIAAGDTIELGLLRFEVESEGVTASRPLHRDDPAPRPGAAHPGVAPASRDAIADAVAFDLRELAFPTADTAPDGAALAQRLDDPFGVLDIVGAEAWPSSDPLAELLGEAATPAARRTGRYLDPLRSTPSDAEAAPMGRTSAVTQRAPGHKGTSAAVGSASANPAAHLFDGLHEEFVRVVRDPTQLAGRTDWEGILAPDGEHAPSLDELSRDAEPYALLRDILLPREGIDRTIEDFDPLGRSTLLDVSETEDVLRLFAPELAHGAKLAVPSLTRSEHHDMSPDSHMQLGSTRPDDKESQ